MECGTLKCAYMELRFFSGSHHGFQVTKNPVPTFWPNPYIYKGMMIY